jgi:hypothetical protein
MSGIKADILFGFFRRDRLVAASSLKRSDMSAVDEVPRSGVVVRQVLRGACGRKNEARIRLTKGVAHRGFDGVVPRSG